MTNNEYYPKLVHSRQHIEPRSQHPAADGMNPSSGLLQDLLREKKAAQHARRMSESEQSTYERQVQSSPLGPSTTNQSDPKKRRTSAFVAPKEMGLREMEEYISKISKQNFDLKLEIFHRRQRNEALEAKAIKVDELESHNEELRQVNDDLLHELEKRDAAVQEAVTLICNLEARIDQLEKERSSHTQSIPTFGDTIGHTSAQSPKQAQPTTIPPPSTPETKHRRTPSANRSFKDRQDDILRSPSFLRDASPSTSALRGLFANQDDGLILQNSRLDKPSTQSLHRVASLLSQDEDPDTMDGDTFSQDHRRLSLLSASSFVSLYGQGKEEATTPTANPDGAKVSGTQEKETSFTRKLSPQEGRIKSWIDSKDHPSNLHRKPVQIAKTDTFSSIGTVLGSTKPRDTPSLVSPTPSRRHRQDVSLEPMVKTSQKPSLAGPIFGPDVLPPTPGTMSTATLGGRSSNQSIVDDRSLNGGQSRPSSGARSALPETRPYGATSKVTTAQRRSPQVMDDSETDIEVSENEYHHATAEVNRSSGFSQANPFSTESSVPDRTSSVRTSPQPPAMSPSRDFMFNGEGIDCIRPARTISRPLPSSSHYSTSKVSSKSNAQAPASSKAQAKNSSKESSTQQEAEPVTSPSIRRSLSTRSKSSNSTAQLPPPQKLTDRLFRRNTSHPNSTTRPDSPEKIQPQTTTSPESKTRPPRPSSLYIRSDSNQLPSPSATPIKVTRTNTRPGMANNPGALDPAAWRRNSVALMGTGDNNGVAANGEVNGQQLQQQQGKRLSVGAFGRSASLRIKEGLRGKK